MTKLLPELIPLIISYRATSLALALVNKQYNDIVTLILYKAIFLNGIDAIKAFSDTMTSGRPKLCQYPTYLHIFYRREYSTWDGIDPDNFIPALKQVFMHVPHLSDLTLVVNEWLIHYIIDEPRYPFQLRRLDIPAVRDAIFAEFLRTQPEIEHISLWRDPDLDGSSPDTTPLQPDILPKLRSIEGDTTSISIIVPLRPVTDVHIYGEHWSFGVHEKIAKSLAPLEILTEYLTFPDEPWESGVVSRCLSSLEFSWKSLQKYSLALRPDWRHKSALSFLKASSNCTHLFSTLILNLQERGAPSHGLDIIRNSLSTFSALTNFRLAYHDHNSHSLNPEFCETVPELCQFDVWQESCPNLEEVTLFGITLKKA